MPKTLGLFFIGIYASRQNIIQKIKQNTGVFLAICLVLISLSIVWEINKIDFFNTFDLEKMPIYRPILIAINVMFESFLGFGYIFGFIILFQNSRLISSVMAKTGRMALSNYILQSLFCVFIFYGYGLGFYGKLNPSDLVFIVVGIFMINILFSHLYLRKKKMGPLEYCWRKLTKRSS